MKVLIVEPGKRPIKADIDHTLHNLHVETVVLMSRVSK